MIPHARRLRGALRPTFHFQAIDALDPAFVRLQGIEGFIWDVDGTLMGHYHTAVAVRLQPAFRSLCELPGLRHVILSNCGEQRFIQLGELFPGLPVLRAYETSEGVVYRRRQGRADEWLTAEGSAAGPPERARPLKKPSIALMEFAVRELRSSTREAVVMVGDQYVTDIVGANMVGVRSIKVDTVEPESFPPGLRRLQALDRALFALFHGAAGRGAPGGGGAAAGRPAR